MDAIFQDPARFSDALVFASGIAWAEEKRKRLLEDRNEEAPHPARLVVGRLSRGPFSAQAVADGSVILERSGEEERLAGTAFDTFATECREWLSKALSDQVPGFVPTLLDPLFLFQISGFLPDLVSFSTESVPLHSLRLEETNCIGQPVFRSFDRSGIVRTLLGKSDSDDRFAQENYVGQSNRERREEIARSVRERGVDPARGRIVLFNDSPSIRDGRHRAAALWIVDPGAVVPVLRLRFRNGAHDTVPFPWNMMRPSLFLSRIPAHIPFVRRLPG